MCVWRCVCGECDVFGFGGVMCLFLEVDVCDVFVFVVVCLLCVEREREKREREERERKKIWWSTSDQVRNSWSVRNCTKEHWYSFQLAIYHTRSEPHCTDKCP